MSKQAKGFTYKEQYAVIVMCDGEEHQKQLYEELKGKGHNCKVVVV